MILKALFYKAWCIHRHHVVQSILLIVLPALLFMYLNKLFVIKYDGTGQHQNTIFYERQLKAELLLPHSTPVNVVYCPINPFTTRLINYVKIILTKGEFIGVDRESDVEKWFMNHSSLNHDFRGSDDFGVIFHVDDSSSQSPLHFKYTIRGITQKIPEAENLFPIIQHPGPMEAGLGYFESQFLRLKIAFDDSFLRTIGLNEVNWTLQEFPYPSLRGKREKSYMDQYYPILVTIAFLYNFMNLALFVVNAKIKGITERLRIVGMDDFMLVLGYLIHSFITYVISTALLTVVFKFNVISSALLGNSNYLIIWLVLILFCLQSTGFFLASSAIFTNPSMVGTVTVFLFLLPCALILYSPNTSVAGQASSSLLPVLYLSWVFQNILGYENSGVGVTFFTLFKVPPSGYCSISLAGLMCLSFIGTVLYCLLYIYIVNVKPGPFGFAKPWHFPASHFCRANQSDFYSKKSDHDPVKGLYERVPDNVEVGLQISDLHKRFGNILSVYNVSLDIYVGQITALLGHNGAGKTTTLSMISGIYKPTSGAIYYHGYNVFANLHLFRQDLGLCPQDNMLIDDISVWEHLLIFAMIKNIPSKELDTSATHALNQVNLTHKKHAIVEKLSGGMKRKLCLAIALIGNPEVLILDEPTSGLDPESRREIWNILLTFRENRVMIITTHFMEEADALGDQIAIMDHGEIKCYGTPMFLKKHYGAGYQIMLSSDNSTNFDNIIQFVKERIPPATVINKTEDYIAFNIPSSKSGDFSSLFSELETNHIFSLSRIGIQCTTLDDVFLKVREEAVEQAPCKTPYHNENLYLDVPFVSGAHSLNPCTSFSQRLTALFLKNIMYMRSNWICVLMLVVIIPIVLSYGVISNSFNFLNPAINASNIAFDLEEYGATDVLLDGLKTPEIRRSFTELINKGGHHYIDIKSLHTDNIIDGLLKVATDDEPKFRQSFIVAGSFNETIPNVLYSSIAIHSPVIAVNLLYNSFLKSENKNYTITSISRPFTFTSGLCGRDFEVMKVFVLIAWINWMFAFIPIIDHIFVKAPHNERTSLMKHLQLMTGVSPFTYWLSFFLRDVLIFGIWLALNFTIFKCFDAGLLSINNALGVLALIVALFGVSIIWLAYCLTFIFKTPSDVANVFFLGSILIVITALVSFNLIHKESEYIFFTYILRLIPFSSFVYALQLFLFKATAQFQCRMCPNAYILPHCSTDYTTGDYIDSDLAHELYFLAFDCILYFVIVMLAEFGILSKFKYIIILSRHKLMEDSNLELVESDVAKERDRVDAVLQSSDEVGPSMVIVDGITKMYTRNFIAVCNVSFASKEGECFGLLGINGAGKTTMFNILSGVLPPTKGRVLIKGYDMNERKRLCLSFVGYCPQFSALGEGLTGREMLTLFANLRLAQPRHIEKLVNSWISLLGLEEYCDRVCGTYSGGNKRKLSTAMAFINNPSVILLDEPSSGMDPVTRRNLWTVLKKCQNNKQTIIISSHSMDECEAVCERLTIMANGYMKCIGNTQHLKHLYGQGYIILIKLKYQSEVDKNSLKLRISREFDSKAALQDEHMTLLHYLVSDTKYQLSSLFNTMENIFKESHIIEEYSITDASLEHIFLSFAKKKDES